jgi:hypothetical protein
MRCVEDGMRLHFSTEKLAIVVLAGMATASWLFLILALLAAVE